MITVLGILASGAVASQQEYGGAAGAMFRFGYGSRAMGLGGAVVSIAQDLSSVLFNPAGAARLGGGRAELGLTVLPLNRRLQFLGIGQRVDSRVGWTLTWLSAGVGDLRGYDGNGEPTGSLDFREQQFAFSFGYRTGSSMALGVSGKHYRHRLADDSTYGWGIDIGVIAQPYPGLQIGFAARDLGGEVIWEETENDNRISVGDRYRTVYAMGASYRPLLVKVLFVVDVERVRHEGTYINAGVSYSPAAKVILRAGVRRIPVGDGAVDPAPTAGITVRPKLGARQVGIDYAVTTDTFGTVHTLGLVF
ncbi:MAG: hypothetical protein QGH20_02115 [Candidatus Latescibacteria bacterium]|nr:hypothetical protein [Candidatus Latescibacterota bacterium]